MVTVDELMLKLSALPGEMRVYIGELADNFMADGVDIDRVAVVRGYSTDADGAYLLYE
jgi:hypothetical protein